MKCAIAIEANRDTALRLLTKQFSPTLKTARANFFKVIHGMRGSPATGLQGLRQERVLRKRG